MLVFFISLYLVVTVVIGLLAVRFVKTARDFAIAGRKLPLMITASALFATWFGSETVMGASSEFIHHGLIGVIEDPFGAALCLFLIGAFFVRPLYRMNLLTMGDFFKNRYGFAASIVCSVFMICSYLGWIAAQLVAFAIILNIVSGLPVVWGLLISASVVLIYTYAGGMWAVSITDFIQTIVIICGLLALAVQLVGQAGGMGPIFDACPDGFFKFLPEPNTESVLQYINAWMIIGLGSIPQQDVFQRVMSAESEKVAIRASFVGCAMYLSIALLPLCIAAAAKVSFPELMDLDGQMVLPIVVMRHSNPFMQVMFFGALLSAIMSTASGSILAPATTLAENIIKPFMHKLDDHKFLMVLRISVVIMTLTGLLIAGSNRNIYHLVGESSSVSLVALFVPLVAGLWWKPATKSGAFCAMFIGIAVWIMSHFGEFDFLPIRVPELMIALFASFLGMIIGTLFDKVVKKAWEA
jgi:SSS family transporter